MSYYDNYSATNDPLASLDLSGYDTQDTFDYSPIPAGNYPVVIEKADFRKGKRSQYLNVQFKVMDGPCKGRSVFDTFVLFSDDPTVNIDVGRQRYKTLRLVIGLNPNTGGNTKELCGLPLIINVGLRARRDNPDQIENKVNGFNKPTPAAPATAYVASAPQIQPPAAAPAPTPTTASTDELPWEM